MDSNASNNIYFKPSYRTTEQGEQQGLSSVKQSLHELPQPNSNPKFGCGSMIIGEAVPWNSYIRSEPRSLEGVGTEQAAGQQEVPWLSPLGCTTGCPCCL